MERLLKSSKFWSLVIGGVSLLLVQIFGQTNEELKTLLDQISVLYLAAAPVILAIMNGVEDAFSDGSFDLEDLIQIIRDLLDEVQPE